ncbi:MAG: VWA domain-containing protein [Saprospiraceae bacterium]|nr:VWA domain-containing protein [Saprospiraceae bacterium]
MFKLENTTALYLLAIIPLMALIFYSGLKKLDSRKKTFGHLPLVKSLMTGRFRFSPLIYFLWIVGIVLCLIMAIVNPQWGYKKEKVKVDKSDIMIALDISASMNATDISPSRLEKAKRFVEALIESRKGDQIGLILFAGGAYLQMPLTSDYAAAELFVRAANTEMAGTQGTAIGEAIALARRSVLLKDKHQRALIMITDGEDHDEEALDLAKESVDDGWNIFTIGVGTNEGSFVPVNNEGREEFKVDEAGNPVKSILNASLLKNLADNGNGSFYILNDGSDIISNLNTQLEKMQKRSVEVKSFTEFRSFYQYFLGIALLMMLAGYFAMSITGKKTDLYEK